MKKKGPDIIPLLKRISEKPVQTEILYMNRRLIDDLFENLFGGTTNLLQFIERTSEREFKSMAGAGIGEVLSKMFLDIKASIGIEGKIGKKTKSIVEKGLTYKKKIALCEALLAEQDMVEENPGSREAAEGRYINVVDTLLPYTPGEEEKIKEDIGSAQAEVIISRWKKDQLLTPGSVQVLLLSPKPFIMASIVKIQQDVAGSTYLAYQPPAPKHRSVFAELLGRENGISFLKTYWIVDFTLPE